MGGRLRARSAPRPNLRDCSADSNRCFRWLDGGVREAWFSK
jgi:hypothetical protein